MKRYLVLMIGCLAVALSGARAEVVAYWRFEGGSSSFVKDSGKNGLDLTPMKAQKDGGNFPRQKDLSASGPGSGFYNAESNKSAAQITDEEGGMFRVTDQPALSFTHFTVEMYVNLARSMQKTAGSRMLVGQGVLSKTSGGWGVGVTSEGSSRGARKLMFQFVQQSVGWEGNNVVTVESDIQLKENTDYFIAVELEEAGVVSFYVKDLTNKRSMDSIEKHVKGFTGLNDSTDFFQIGGAAPGGDIRWDGLIDEVRISNECLPESQLLINTPHKP